MKPIYFPTNPNWLLILTDYICTIPFHQSFFNIKEVHHFSKTSLKREAESIEKTNWKKNYILSWKFSHFTNEMIVSGKIKLVWSKMKCLQYDGGGWQGLLLSFQLRFITAVATKKKYFRSDIALTLVCNFFHPNVKLHFIAMRAQVEINFIIFLIRRLSSCLTCVKNNSKFKRLSAYARSESRRKNVIVRESRDTRTTSLLGTPFFSFWFERWRGEDAGTERNRGNIGI